MARVRQTSEETRAKTIPSIVPDNHENKMIALAMDVAEERLRNGTATSQMIIHYLKLGSSKERLEKEILELQKQLIEAKTESLRSQKRTEEMFREAIDAFRSYSGQDNQHDDEEYDDEY